MKKFLVTALLIGLAPFASPNRAHAQPEGWTTAEAALRALGAPIPGSSNRCSNCHAINSTQLDRWQTTTNIIYWSCISDYLPRRNATPFKTPLQAINCLRDDPDNPASKFSPQKLGLLAAGVQTTVFKTLFKDAYGEANYRDQYQRFVSEGQMPVQGRNPMSDTEFDATIKWYQDGMRYMKRILGESPNPPASCAANISSELRNHITTMKTSGWETKNLENGLRFFGCGPNQKKSACLQQKTADGKDLFPLSSSYSFGRDWNKPLAGSVIRILRPLGFTSSFWMRSSPDGRFVANGNASASGDSGSANYSGVISDLNAALPRTPGLRDIKINGSYDPSFFPDNSGFVFQGSVTGICNLHILENPSVTKIDFTESDCSRSVSFGLYQSVGTSLDGRDYLAVTGFFDSDNGNSPSTGGNPSWGESGQVGFTYMRNNGRNFAPAGLTTVQTPFLGDWNTSPSTQLIIGRLAGENSSGNAIHLGYKIFRPIKSEVNQTVNVQLREVATICNRGLKGQFSFDESWYVTYDYVRAEDYRDLGYASARDPEFQRLLSAGSANIFLTNLIDGTQRRVTRMGPGQFAQFPHFRSDGWIYFMARTATGERYVAATDAAILLGVLRDGR